MLVELWMKRFKTVVSLNQKRGFQLRWCPKFQKKPLWIWFFHQIKIKLDSFCKKLWEMIDKIENKLGTFRLESEESSAYFLSDFSLIKTTSLNWRILRLKVIRPKLVALLWAPLQTSYTIRHRRPDASSTNDFESQQFESQHEYSEKKQLLISFVAFRFGLKEILRLEGFPHPNKKRKVSGSQKSGIRQAASVLSFIFSASNFQRKRSSNCL